MQNPDPFNQSEEYLPFTAGQTIFHAGDPGDTLYIIAEGQVDIVLGNQIIETVQAGGLVGEFALIDDKPRSASAIARSDCLLAPISRPHFLTLIQRTPLFALQVMRVMADRLRRANALIQH
jgi:CRP/FNR family transcriptional regulator, cyclic AMP receptor protein